MYLKKLEEIVLNFNVNNVAFVDVKDIRFEESFRDLCKMNSCGLYGKSWMCPPDVGEIKELINKAKSYDYALVYNTIHRLKDSYDIEGMLESGEIHNHISNGINTCLLNIDNLNTLHLSAGGCKICKVCSKIDNKPCRFPQKAIPSLEAYGIAVSELASLAGINYINGQNTVTYFGAIFIKEG